MTRKAAATQVYCTSFCNKGHRLSDGIPVAHECYVLNPEALRLEREGKLDEATALPEGFRTNTIVRGA